MSRTADPRRPAELLDRALYYVAVHGLSELSLRPLAIALGTSPRNLLYYFGSKEQLIAQLFKRLRSRHHGAIAMLQSQTFVHPADACRAIWRAMSATENMPLYVLFFETFAHALRDRERYAEFLHDVVDDWLDFIAAPMIATGTSEEAARQHATIVLAGFRGFLMDLCATQDRKRIDSAVDQWLKGFEMTNDPSTPLRYARGDKHA